MTTFDLKQALLAAAKDLIAREKELSLLDSVVGDGDHGVTVRRGFAAIESAIEREAPLTAEDLMTECAMAFGDAAGGAMGPIMTSFFLGMAGAAPEGEALTAGDLAALFGAGLAGVQRTGGAELGDKTLVDALSPAVDALGANQAASPRAAMTLAAKAALEGAEATKSMVSKKGRSRNLGERSLGYVDAGCMTMYYFFRAMAENLPEEEDA